MTYELRPPRPIPPNLTDPRWLLTEIERLRAEVSRATAERDSLLSAVQPFVRLAAGIPCNWRANCVLTIEESPGSGRHHRLNSLAERDNETGLTIRHWWNLREVVECIQGEVLPDGDD